MHIYIIVPYHGESKEVYSKLFTSLNNQVGIDFNDITITVARSDGQYEFPDVLELNNIRKVTQFISYPCEISGPGQSRQVALDWIQQRNDIGDWGLDGVLFCDVDDYLYDENVLNKLFSWAPLNSNYDILQFFSNQINIDGSESFVDRISLRNLVWAKLFRLQTIYKYDIRFSKLMETQEDFLFTECFESLENLHLYIFDDIYIYTHVASINSQGYKNWTNKTAEKWLEDNILLLNEYKRWLNKMNASTNIVSYIHIIEGILSIIITNGIFTWTKSQADELDSIFKEYRDITLKYKYNYELLNKNLQDIYKYQLIEGSENNEQ